MAALGLGLSIPSIVLQMATGLGGAMSNPAADNSILWDESSEADDILWDESDPTSYILWTE